MHKEIRYFIYQHFIEYSNAPHYEQIAIKFNLSIKQVFEYLNDLMEEHLIVLQPHTKRILFANPFSNIPTNFIVIDLSTDKKYFANCGWDSVATHFMIKHPIRIQTHCQETLEKIELELDNFKITKSTHQDAIVYITKPAKQWWENIIDTCSNHMYYFSSIQAANKFAKKNNYSGHALTNEQLYGLCEFLYDDKMELDYIRPTKEETISKFQELGLSSKFWEL